MKYTLLLLSLISISYSLPLRDKPVKYLGSMDIDNDLDIHYDFSNISCNECLRLVELISYDVKVENKTITSILNIVKTICLHLIGPTAKQCYNIASDIENIVKLINAGLSPPNICSKLGFCQNIKYEL